MIRISAVILGFLVFACLRPLAAIDAERDFSGKWILDPNGSNTQALSEPLERTLTIAQEDASIRCSTSFNGSPVAWSYSLNRDETQLHLGDETRSSVVKWEGAALLVNTLVSGTQNYTLMDRWALSRDHSRLTITRQILRGAAQSEGTLVFRREGTTQPLISSNAPAPPLSRPAAPAAPSEITVSAGTRIPLTLRNGVDTKHSREGDRVYLETAFPIAVDGRIVIPPGSSVNATITTSKPAGVVKGKGELFLRFDSLTLPNGVTRDFRSRLASADNSAVGKVDPKEGKVTGERDKSGTARTTAEGGAIGASVGTLAGAAAGSPLKGAGIGAAAGAAAGLASVLIKHRPDAAIPAGSTVEMVLDRDLHYLPAELKF
jgi:type IV secretion system protein VirB10